MMQWLSYFSRAVSCPDGDCECPSCLVSMVSWLISLLKDCSWQLFSTVVKFEQLRRLWYQWWVSNNITFERLGLATSTWTIAKVVNNELIFFRKFSDPDTRKDKEDEPRLHYYKIKILQVRMESVCLSLFCLTVCIQLFGKASWRFFLIFCSETAVRLFCVSVCLYVQLWAFICICVSVSCLIVQVFVYVSVVVSLCGVNEDWITHPNASKMLTQNAFQTTRFFCNWRVAKANWL